VHRLRAMAHPVRLQMLSLLTGTAMSAAEVARELGTTSANASYHLRLLHAAGLLAVAGEEKVNGGVAKRYRHVWDQPPPEVGTRSQDDVEPRCAPWWTRCPAGCDRADSGAGPGRQHRP